MLYIEQCYEHYNEIFSEDWLMQAGFNGSDNDVAILIAKVEELLSFSFEATDSLSRSILSGEYIINKDKVKKILNDLLGLLRTDYLIKSFPCFDKLLDDTISFNNSFIQCINRYLELIYLFENKFEDASIFSVFKSSKEIPVDEMYGSFSCFVEWVEPLCKIDYTLSFKEDLIEHLFYIRQSLIENKTFNAIKPDLLNALLDKASFLLLKLQHVRDTVSIIYYNSQKYELNINELHRDKISSLETFYNILQNDDYRKTFMFTNLDSLERKLAYKSISVSELIILLKYYQKSNSRSEVINDIVFYYNNYLKKEFRSEDSNSYDVRCIHILWNYIYNSRLSNILSRKNCSIDELRRFYDEICEYQDEARIKNFHPYEKILVHIKEKYLSSIENTDSETYERIISLYRDCLTSYADSIEWCSKNDFYPFLLPYKDSLIDYDDGFKVFYPSSFSRPLRYNLLKKNLADFIRDYDIYRMNKYIIQEHKNIVDIESQIKNTKKESYQLLGVFTTIVTFLFASIDVFAKTKSIKETLLATLGVGIVLFFFNSLIFSLLLSRTDFKNKTTRFYIVIIGFILSFVILLLLLYWMFLH